VCCTRACAKETPVRHVVWLLSGAMLCLVLSAIITSAADTPPEVALVLEQHRFSPEELRVKANAPFILVITNKDKEEEEFEMASLRIEKIVPGGKTLPLKMPALKPGTYQFIGDFHEKTAKGRIIAE
jgi:hypothetical protein